jgi:aminoglycoside phosphotransferase (APT) family kinase protein
LARVLGALQRIDPAGGPPPGPHNFYRGGPLAMYDGQTRQANAALAGAIDAAAVAAVWEAALEAPWRGSPVWLHGDVSPANLLVNHQGQLCAVIDFGSSGVGDPACDVTIAWTLLAGASRGAFRAALPADGALWARGRGWALWKGLITLAADTDRDSGVASAGEARRVIDDGLADHAQPAQPSPAQPSQRSKDTPPDPT